MFELPYDYKLMNELNQFSLPNGIKLMDNSTFAYYCKYLLQKAMSAFKFTIPETWEMDYFLEVLFRNGFIAVLNTNDFGIIPQHCTPGGYNVFYEPRYVNVANPLLPNITRLDIGKDCAVIKLMPEWSGVTDIVATYAARLALCAETLQQSLFNSQISFIFAAEDKACAKSFEEMYDRVHRGEPAVAVGKKLFDVNGKPLWQPFNTNTSYLANDILLTMNKIECEFDAAIGLPNVSTEKKERLVTNEVNASNSDVSCRAALWIDTMTKGIQETIALYPELNGKLSVDWRMKSTQDYNIEEENANDTDDKHTDTL